MHLFHEPFSNWLIRNYDKVMDISEFNNEETKSDIRSKMSRMSNG